MKIEGLLPSSQESAKGPYFKVLLYSLQKGAFIDITCLTTEFCHAM
jgi:hypothetical protein